MDRWILHGGTSTTISGGGLLVAGGEAPGGALGIILGNAEVYW
jgi:hypothetical protein